MAAIRENARLVFTMTWAKAVLFSRAIVDSVNDGNLLVAFQSLRSYVELVAAVRFTVKRMEPLVRDAVARGQVSHETAQSLANHMQILLHGGRHTGRKTASQNGRVRTAMDLSEGQNKQLVLPHQPPKPPESPKPSAGDDKRMPWWGRGSGVRSERRGMAACLGRLSRTTRQAKALRPRFGPRSLFLDGTFRPHVSPRRDRINYYSDAR
jgi:hypothetical protein